MALHFYFGGAGSGKSWSLFQKICEMASADPDTRYLVLVPEQFTMETQRKLVRIHPRHGLLNIEVLSISRLAFRVFEECGATGEQLIEEIGKTFFLEKLALEERDHLKWFGKNLAKPAYIAEIKAMISEFLLYGVSPEMLEEEAERREGSALSVKLQDLALILRGFRKKTEDSFLTAEEVPEKLAGLLSESSYVRDAVVAMDGFTGFTPLQEELIRKMLPLCRDFYITLTIDHERNPFQPSSRGDLFGLTVQTAMRLRELASEEGVRVEKPVYIEPGPRSRHSGSPHLAYLEAALFRPGRKAAAELKKDGEERDLRIFHASSPRAEMEETARLITKLVREENLKYREIAVVCADLETQGSYASRIFRAYGIPAFIDEKRELIRNPYIEYLRALLEVLSESYSYEAVFRMLKTGMSPLSTDEVESLENYVIALGIRGKKKWHERFIRHYEGQDPAEVTELEELRKRFVALTDPVAETFSKRRSTVREKTEALLSFIEEGQAEELLAKRAEELLAEGRTENAKEYERILPYIRSIMEKLIAVLGNETISVRDYRALLEAGFAEGKLGIIPPGNDRVIVGDSERTRLPDVKVLFFCGMNEGLVPKRPEGGRILSEADRRAIASGGSMRLKPTSREQMYIERFYLYNTLTRPSERLYLSYSLLNAKGESMRPSYLIASIRDLFPDISLTDSEMEKDALPEKKEEGLSRIAELIAGIETERLKSEDLELFRYYRFSPEFAARTELLLGAASSAKRGDRISRAAARLLYGSKLHNSASRLELFSRCEAAHFLRYGLRLGERPEYSFSGLDFGTILHRALELFANEADRGAGWVETARSEEALTELAGKCLDEAAVEYTAGIFLDSARYAYERERMLRLFLRSIRVLGQQMEAGDFRIAGTETSFSRKITIASDADGAGGEMILGGRIDRLETCEAGDVTLVKVVDYKSGRVIFEPAAVYYGLELQLPLYLEAAVEEIRKKGGNPAPAAMMYFNIADPLVDYAEGMTEEDLRAEILKKMKGSGVVSADPEVLIRLDRSLHPGYSSQVIPAGFKKDGELTQASMVLQTEEFAALEKHADRIMEKAARSILNGYVRVNPVRYKTEDACRYCPYRPVCAFDSRIPGYRVRLLGSLSKDEVMQKIAAMTVDESETEE